jgi:glyceraldehyde-3-phosphate dehydrogenase (NADP+)
VEEFVQSLNDVVDPIKPGLAYDKDIIVTRFPEFDKLGYRRSCLHKTLANSAKIMNANVGYTNILFAFISQVYPANEKMKFCHEEQFEAIIPIVTFDSTDRFVNLVSVANINCQSRRDSMYFRFVGRKDSAEGTLCISNAV